MDLSNLKVNHMERKPGFYWTMQDGEWTVSEWVEGNCWFLAGCDSFFSDNYFEKIDERQIVRK